MQTEQVMMAFGPLPEDLPHMKPTESMLSMATAMDSDSSDIAEDSHLTPRRGSVMRVHTLRESIANLDINHEALFVDEPHVHWGTTEINWHGIILGCNPSVTKGPPLTITWKATGTRIMSVDEFEADRKPSRPDFLLRKSSMERNAILKEAGFSSEEFKMVEDHIEEIRSSRELSKAEKTDLAAMMAESKRKKAEMKKTTKKGIFGLFRKKKQAISSSA